MAAFKSVVYTTKIACLFNDSMKLATVLLFLCSPLPACRDLSSQHKASQSIVASGKTRDTLRSHYPLDSLHFFPEVGGEGDSLLKMMYSDLLYQFREPIYYNSSNIDSAVRLLWVRPFDKPVIISCVKNGDRVYYSIKELEKQMVTEDSFTYKKNLDTTFLTSESSWVNVSHAIRSDDFFNLMSSDRIGNNKDVTIWVLECRWGNQYRCINRFQLNDSLLPKYKLANGLLGIAKKLLPDVQ